MNLYRFVARGMAAYEFHVVARTIQRIGEKAHQGFVCRGIDRGRGHFDAQFVAERFADLIGGRARLEFDCNQNSVGLRAEETR